MAQKRIWPESMLGVPIAAAAGRTSPEALRGEAAGRAAAEREIAEGKPCLLFIGLPATDRNPLDPETGLPTRSCGCVVDDATLAFVRAHNDATVAALEDGRLAGMTFENQTMTQEFPDDDRGR